MKPRHVLTELPGWRNATVSELEGGLTNRSWLVEANANNAVLKIDPAPRDAPFNDRRVEARIQSAAADAGLAAAVIHASDTVLMTEYIEGRVWAAADLNDDANLKQLATALRQLHALPRTGRTFDALAAAKTYAACASDADPQRVQDSLAAIAALPQPQTLCCCHNDLVADNIIATPAIRFLDFEYACDNDPLFDLATVVAHHELSPHKRDVLLNAYFEDADNWRERLPVIERGYRALLWLWQAAGAQADFQHEPGGDRG